MRMSKFFNTSCKVLLSLYFFNNICIFASDGSKKFEQMNNNDKLVQQMRINMSNTGLPNPVIIASYTVHGYKKGNSELLERIKVDDMYSDILYKVKCRMYTEAKDLVKKLINDENYDVFLKQRLFYFNELFLDKIKNMISEDAETRAVFTVNNTDEKLFSQVCNALHKKPVNKKKD